MKLTPRTSTGHNRGVMKAASNTIIESADAIAETAQAFRRTMKITNQMLITMEAEVYLDGVQALVDKGLTTAEAVATIESMR